MPNRIVLYFAFYTGVIEALAPKTGRIHCGAAF
jgi:hypothetical protein